MRLTSDLWPPWSPDLFSLVVLKHLVYIAANNSPPLQKLSLTQKRVCLRKQSELSYENKYQMSRWTYSIYVMCEYYSRYISMSISEKMWGTGARCLSCAPLYLFEGGQALTRHTNTHPTLSGLRRGLQRPKRVTHLDTLNAILCILHATKNTLSHVL